MIEGDTKKQRKLDAGPWNFEKVWKKGLKHFLFFSISFLIANTFLGYLIGGDDIINLVTHSPAANMGTFVSLVIFTGIFYFVFANFREQVCTTICPYGRLQGVMLTKDSIQVSYDYKRGEPRGKIRKKASKEEQEAKGDCIACGHCEFVCPTGIDIKNGPQLECVNCTACIDACDTIMDKIGKPRGLIRYASENNIAEGKTFKFTGRIIGYTIILTGLIGVVLTLLVTRPNVETTVLRAPGTLYLKAENGNLRNLYTLQVVNKTEDQKNIFLRLVEPDGILTLVGDTIKLKPGDVADGAFLIELPKDKLDGLKTPVTIEVLHDAEVIETKETVFMGPAK